MQDKMKLDLRCLSMHILDMCDDYDGNIASQFTKRMAHLGCSICISSVIVAISLSLTANFFSSSVVRACINRQLLYCLALPEAMSLLI